MQALPAYLRGRALLLLLLLLLLLGLLEAALAFKLPPLGSQRERPTPPPEPEPTRESRVCRRSTTFVRVFMDLDPRTPHHD